MFVTTGHNMAAGAPAIIFQAIGRTGAGVGEGLAFLLRSFPRSFPPTFSLKSL